MKEKKHEVENLVALFLEVFNVESTWGGEGGEEVECRKIKSIFEYTRN
jgi:hypothetical protein